MDTVIFMRAKYTHQDFRLLLVRNLIEEFGWKTKCGHKKCFVIQELP